MIKKFGVKEAAAAGVFAKNKEQKETVLGVLAMMGIPVVIKEQVKKLVGRLERKISKRRDKIDAVKAKQIILKNELCQAETDRDGIEFTEQEWELYNLR